MIEIYEKRIPKEEDFDNYDEYEEKLEDWASITREDIPISEGVYEDLMDYYEYEHITSKVFIIEGKYYRVDVVYFHDGERPDDLNTRILLVVYEGS